MRKPDLPDGARHGEISDRQRVITRCHWDN
jgi:hypothetical protein